MIVAQMAEWCFWYGVNAVNRSIVKNSEIFRSLDSLSSFSFCWMTRQNENQNFRIFYKTEILNVRWFGAMFRNLKTF